jgi:hypothetical protein
MLGSYLLNKLRKNRVLAIVLIVDMDLITMRKSNIFSDASVFIFQHNRSR